MKQRHFRIFLDFKGYNKPSCRSPWDFPACSGTLCDGACGDDPGGLDRSLRPFRRWLRCEEPLGSLGLSVDEWRQFFFFCVFFVRFLLSIGGEIYSWKVCVGLDPGSFMIPVVLLAFIEFSWVLQVQGRTATAEKRLKQTPKDIFLKQNPMYSKRWFFVI